jgi:hypothetical protein
MASFVIAEAVAEAVAVAVAEGVGFAVEKGVEVVVVDAVSTAVATAVAGAVTTAVAEAIRSSLEDNMKAKLSVAFGEASAQATINALSGASADTLAAVERSLMAEIGTLGKAFTSDTMKSLLKLGAMQDAATTKKGKPPPFLPPPLPRKEWCKLARKVMSFPLNDLFVAFAVTDDETGEILHADCIGEAELQTLMVDQAAGTHATSLAKKIDLFKAGCTKVPFSNELVCGVDGSTEQTILLDKPRWMPFWRSFFNEACEDECKVTSNDGLKHGTQTSGGHLEKEVLDGCWHMLPICQSPHGGVMKTNADSTAIKIPTLLNTPSFLVNYAESSSSVTVLAVQIGQNSSVEDTLSPAMSGLVKEVIEKQAGAAMKRMLKEPFSVVSNAIKQAGEETKTFTDDCANDVELTMLIPFHGWVKGGIMLSEMKEKCLACFNQRAAALVGEKMSNVRAVMMSQLLNIVMDIKSSADWKSMT